MGGQLARSRSSVIADTLFMLHDRIVGCLDIADADVLLQFLVREKDHGDHLVEETTAAADLSGCQVTVVVNREPDWCTNKCFKKFSESRGLYSRRSNQVELKVFEGGHFIYQRYFRRRIGPAGWLDENTTARGRWHCHLGDGDHVLSLSGTSKILKTDTARDGRYHRHLQARAFTWAMPKSQLLNDWLATTLS
mmetsp:Transcript_69724/g.110147  ORF Transcript_69724/g.110147 Transcript_69724/m.110147 type:complete len:193 (+) Transcript_69724:45-623(+)